MFVPRTAPGDRIEVELDLGAKPLRGRLLRVVEPSPSRVEPPCAHVVACGGCDWMHLSASAQAEGHRAIVLSAIRHATGLDELPLLVVHPAPSPLGYRTRARLLVEANGGLVSVGYRSAASRTLAPVSACAVLHPVLAPLVSELVDVLAGSQGAGDAHLARGAGGRPVLDLAWDGELAPSAWTLIDARVQQGSWAGARIVLRGASAPAVFGDARPHLVAADGLPLVVAPAAFAQPSDQGAALLARRVAALSFPQGAAAGALVELFAGSGTLSILLAAQAGSFLAVERDPEAAACARRNLSERGLNAKVVTGDADVFPIPRGTSVVVLDPPRTGAPGAAQAVAASRAERVVYVACDPPTLARDVAVLTGAGYRVDALETLELFPQTSHVETVVRLTRRRDRPAPYLPRARKSPPFRA